MSPFDIWFTQKSIAPNFRPDSFIPQQWRGRPISEAIAEAKEM